MIGALITYLLPTILAITLHEAAHGYVALRFGDDTAKRMGRLTLNPLKHIDPLGTVLLPLILFLLKAPFLLGYAKPVPVNFSNLSFPKRDMIFVAFAGPAMNLFLAVVSLFLIHMVSFFPLEMHQTLKNMLFYSAFINVLLAVFNMIPLPPLDGGRIAVGLLPNFLALPLARLEPYGFLILLLLIFLPPFLGINPSPFSLYMKTCAGGIVDFLVNFMGLG